MLYFQVAQEVDKGVAPDQTEVLAFLEHEHQQIDPVAREMRGDEEVVPVDILLMLQGALMLGDLLLEAELDEHGLTLDRRLM